MDALGRQRLIFEGVYLLKGRFFGQHPLFVEGVLMNF